MDVIPDGAEADCGASNFLPLDEGDRIAGEEVVLGEMGRSSAHGSEMLMLQQMERKCPVC